MILSFERSSDPQEVSVCARAALGTLEDPREVLRESARAPGFGETSEIFSDTFESSQGGPWTP